MSHTRAHQTQRGLMAALAALAIVGAAAGLIGSGSLEASTVDTTPQDMQAGALPVRFADIVDRVGPAVVRVEVERSVSPMPTGADETPGHRQFERFFDDDGRKRFGHRQHGKRGPHQREMGGVGSGFAISPDGYIVTNDHVVARADTIRVSFEDGRTLEAELIGRDPKTDLALLKIEAHDLAFVEFADAEPRVGDWVITVGSPFGLGQTVTAGIVSARGRNIGAGPYDDFIQIDAPINRGNSGGPAFNLEGEVVGVNTALFSPTGVSAGIGFAISAALAEDVVADLQADGAVDRGWLGVHIQGLNDVMAESLGLDEAHGAIVSHVIDDGPAATAGIRQGDVILTVQGQAVERVRDLPRLVADLDAGERAAIVVWRNGAEISLSPRSVTNRTPSTRPAPTRWSARICLAWGSAPSTPRLGGPTASTRRWEVWS